MNRDNEKEHWERSKKKKRVPQVISKFSGVVGFRSGSGSAEI